MALASLCSTLGSKSSLSSKVWTGLARTDNRWQACELFIGSMVREDETQNFQNAKNFIIIINTSDKHGFQYDENVGISNLKTWFSSPHFI